MVVAAGYRRSIDRGARPPRRTWARRWALAAIVVVLGLSGCRDDPADGAVGGPEPVGTGTSIPPAATGATTADPGAPVTGAPAPTDDPPAAPVLGPAAVPAAGTYRYTVVSTGGAGETVEVEERTVVPRSGDHTTGVVEVRQRAGEHEQVSVLDWSPDGAVVRSTRMVSGVGTSEDCRWDPPFPELGRLAAGATWYFSSSCAATVEDVPTTFVVEGEGRVVGEDVVTVAGVATPVWRVERRRITEIRARLGDDEVVQRVEEAGVVFVDPARGLPVRSELTVTADGGAPTQRVTTLDS